MGYRCPLLTIIYSSLTSNRETTFNHDYEVTRTLANQSNRRRQAPQMSRCDKHIKAIGGARIAHHGPRSIRCGIKRPNIRMQSARAPKRMGACNKGSPYTEAGTTLSPPQFLRLRPEPYPSYVIFIQVKPFTVYSLAGKNLMITALSFMAVVKPGAQRNGVDDR